MFSVVESRRLYHQVADQMRSLIDRGVFPDGSRLPAERELAELLAVSRPTVREALIVLEVEGRVQIRMGSGVYIISQKPAAAEPVAMDELEGPFELLRARAIVECAIAEEAARVVRPDQIAVLDDILSRMEVSLEDRPMALALDRDFHIAVAAIIDNGTLNRFVGSIHDLRMTPYFEKLASYFENPATWRAAMEEHRAIRDAIAAGSPVGARAAMRAHLDQSQLRLSESFEEEPTDGVIPAAWRHAGGQ
ncbi:FadR/GntR family transcriptional regulator [Pseudorhizobium pelagicum]|uniref:GntR family transcriptional regulator n=1 Tax=Pseudorhizobium pelagicum TaxID=1509405 RepID=A0A922NYN2_9HYPH|nr:FadR/GntR family transcriptional regulator [Pseudorhizobium pelagicum]KEQ05679.1 GntR family transcriptional regulator [Pseudorhizobium pelagicum]KEQ06359.1 GntR family transcriptional regulator [Pseudorhizobium pelagicum]MDY6961566.1 FadR/GntR family transcriptional regulator [Pseudomonadota bacterium]|tara:strand:- start:1828 stop:2574 length:747 start_codon:yes stop_codon:yes gene_type:complete